MDIRLSQYAKDKGDKYINCYRAFKRGEIKNAYQSNTGAIMVKTEDVKSQSVIVEQKEKFELPDLEYKNLSIAADTTLTRNNKSSYDEIPNRFANIDSGLIPIQSDNSSNINVKDAITLCQKAYFNFDIVRNLIDIMTEFSVGKIFFKGGNKKSRKFFESLLKSINVLGFEDKFFREYYRSGNVFIFELKKKIDKADVVKITQLYSLELSKAAESKNVVLPVRFIILNPTDISVNGAVDFTAPVYYKILNSYELSRLRTPQTQQDKDALKALPPAVQKQISQKGVSNISIPLDNENVIAVFYKKQDYEALAVPMIFPVLDNLNWKAEMRKMDIATSRLINQAILLITMGAKPDEGGINRKNIEAMQALFTNESVGRILVSDYTTKAEFVVPEIGDILDPKKYQSVNEDIFNGLNYILVGDEKFANQSIKVQLFVERLKHGREVFINDVLYPIIKRISESLGFKSYPEPYFQEINLKNEVEWARIYTRLAEIGFLTPEETFEALDTGKMPLSDESEEAQTKLKELKDKGLYEPVVGGPFTQNQLADKKAQQQTSKVGGINGRPPGTTRPKSTTKVSPVGTNANLYSFAKIKDNMLLSQKLQDKINNTLKTKFNLKDLNDKQISAAESLCEIIMTNENCDKWLDSVNAYIEKPQNKNSNIVQEINNLAYEHQIDDYLALLLFRSRNDENPANI